MDKRVVMFQILNLLTMVASAYMAWKGLGVLTNTTSPFVVVLSESMSPGFERGDILFLTLTNRPIEIGDIVVFELPNRDIPIVHRVSKIHNDKKDDKLYILTKGDNNPVDDRGLYYDAQSGKIWLKRNEIVGRVSGYLPYLGYVTILMNENPKYKVLVLGLLAFFTLATRE